MMANFSQIYMLLQRICDFQLQPNSINKHDIARSIHDLILSKHDQMMHATERLDTLPGINLISTQEICVERATPPNIAALSEPRLGCFSIKLHTRRSIMIQFQAN